MFHEIIGSFPLFSLRLSLQVAAVATFFVVITGLAAAYLLAQREFRGRDLLDMALTLPLVLPPTVTGYYLIVLFGRNGIVGEIGRASCRERV